MNSVYLSKKIQIELVKLLYKQIKFILWIESFAAICLVMALWGVVNSKLLISWLLFNLLFCGLARHILVYYYRKSNFELGFNYNKTKFWLVLFGIGVLFSGLSWGAAGSILIVKHDMLRQTFITILLVGAVALANPIYSSKRIIYALFLFPVLIPFSIWQILQGGIFIILGVLSCVYTFAMFVISSYYYDMIYNSLYLRFENIDLVNSLSNAKNELEKRTLDLEKSLSLGKATLESTTDGILVVDTDNKIVDYNRKFAIMWQIPSQILEEQDNKTMMKLMVTQLEKPNVLLQRIKSLYSNPITESFDELFFKDKRIYECYSHPQQVGNICVGRVWSFRDITGRKFLEEKLFRQANFDLLTGLPNRALAMDRIAKAVIHVSRFKLNLSALFIDLDRFKVINDSLGHGIGDKLLLEVASRLVKCVRRIDTVSREGGDEFLIILNALETESFAYEIANKILKKIREPFFIDGHNLNVTISIGISFYPRDSKDPELLIRNADIAMYHAKELGRNNLQFFTETLDKKVMARVMMESQLRNALQNNELHLVYQPIVNVETQKIIGLEALLRWRHPKLVDIPTSDFISLAEETGIIIPIGEWVLRTACAQLKKWQDDGYFPIHVAVNLSARQFRQANFLDKISQILEESLLEPRYLAIELTESILMESVGKTMDILSQMKEMGMIIMIDDFGTGYSSLNYLKQLPVEKVKIDRSFIQDIPTQPDDVAITTAIIALAAQLNLTVVAEGVENEDQYKFLVKHHCKEMQGYFFSRPLDAEACSKLLSENWILIT